jgi:hypothetical protein
MRDERYTVSATSQEYGSEAWCVLDSESGYETVAMVLSRIPNAEAMILEICVKMNQGERT